MFESRGNAVPDSASRSHLQVLSSAQQWTNRVSYALTCLTATINPNNANRIANLQYLSQHLPLFLKVANLAVGCSHDQLQLLLTIFNGMLNYSYGLTKEDEALLLRVIGGANLARGSMSGALCQEVLSLCSKFRHSDASTNVLLQVMASKMTADQAVGLIDSFRRGELQRCGPSSLITLAGHYNTDKALLTRVLKAIHWHVANSLPQYSPAKKLEEGTDIAKFIKVTIESNVGDFGVVAMCALVYRQLVDAQKIVERNIVSKNLDTFLRESSLKATGRPYLPAHDVLISSFTDLLPILESTSSSKENLLLQYILNFYARNPFPYRSQLIGNSSQPGALAKQWLLRTTEPFADTAKAGRMSVSESQEIANVDWLPLQCLRTTPAILRKLQAQPSPLLALQTISNIPYLPKDAQLPHLFLLLLEIYVNNKDFASLAQIQRIVREQMTSQDISSRVRGKNQKRFFLCVPLVCSRGQIQGPVEKELAEILAQQAVPMKHKLYLADYLFVNMILTPCKRFMGFLSRQLESSSGGELLALLISYIRPHTENPSPALLDWLGRHFSDELQRLFEIIFSRLIIPGQPDVAKLLFLLEKVGVYGNSWAHVYRWSVASLEEVSEIHPDHTLDCLQIFEMLVQKVQPSSIPSTVIAKFQRAITKSWGLYNHDHLFTLDRIISLLNQHSMLNFREQPLPSFTELVDSQMLFQKENAFYRDELSVHPTTRYLMSLMSNVFFGHTGRDSALKLVLQVFQKFGKGEGGGLTERNVVATINWLLWMFDGAEEPVDARVDELILDLLQSAALKSGQGVFSIQAKCLEYLSSVPHSVNILKLPIERYLRAGFNQPNWLIYLTQLISIVTDARPKAISVYKLQQGLRSLILRLIAITDKKIVNESLDLIEGCCFVEGQYQQIIAEMLPCMNRVLRAEREDVGYRRSLVEFAVSTLQQYEQTIDADNAWFLLRKYATEPEIVEMLLDCFGKGVQTMDQKLLLRIVMTHKQNEQIQAKCRSLFDAFLPASSQQQKFTESLNCGLYAKCEEILPTVSNPYGLNISLSDLRNFLEWNQVASCRKLLTFLYDNPSTHKKLHQCEAFYLRSQFLSLLKQTFLTIRCDPIPEKFNYPPNGQPFIQIKHNDQLTLIANTFASILKNRSNASKFKTFVIDLFKKNAEGASTLIGLLTLVLPYFSSQTVQSMKANYNFCVEVAGELELLDGNRARLQQLTQPVFVFPYTLSNFGDPENVEYCVNFMLHYRALLCNFGIVEREIGSHRYVAQLFGNLAKKITEGEHKDTFALSLIKVHLLIEGNSKFFPSDKFAEPKRQFLKYIKQIESGVNRYLSSKLNENNSKLELGVVAGYLSFLLFTVNVGVGIDLVSGSHLQSLATEIDGYEFPEGVGDILKKTIEWLNKKVEKVQPKEIVKEKPIVKQQPSLKESPKRQQPQPVYQQAPKQLQNAYQSTKKAQPYESIKPKQVDNTSKNSQPYVSIKSKPNDVPPQQEKKQEPKQEADLRKQIEQSYIKYKQIEEHITITEKVTTNRTIYIVETAEDPLSQQTPPPPTFTQEQFLQPTVSVPSQQVSTKQRTQNIQMARKITSGEFSIQSLKDHCRFISSLAELSTLTQAQNDQLLVSLFAVTQTVQSHAFYVKKVADSETVSKLVTIYRNLLISGKSQDALVSGILKLCLAMSQRKQKKLALFGQEQTVQFFKLVVKRALNKGGVSDIPTLLGTLFNCRNNTENYYKLGLLSMVLQLVNRDLAAKQVLQYLTRLQLSMYIINQIYQRGLFNKLVAAFAAPHSQQVRQEINLWIRLAGKVCVNPSIQERFRTKQLHVKVWEKYTLLSQPQERLNICYFFAYLCLKNEAVAEWLTKSRALEQLLTTLKSQPLNEQLYLLFYHFCFGNTSSRDYCFRIKYHIHLGERLTAKWKEVQSGDDHIVLSKYFYKSLGQLMTSKLHVPVFFKEQFVKKLMQIFAVKTEPSIFECLLDFISTLESEAEFDELKRQSFWDALKIFEYKISSEATYSYLLQIFLIMIKKGRTREFNQAQVRSKACLKAEYSINMEGKELALRFVLALSMRNKENYLTERCVRLLASILGLKVSKSELQLLSDMLRIQGSAKNIQFLGFFNENQVDALVVDSLQKLTPEQLQLALPSLATLSINPTNCVRICLQSINAVSKFLRRTEPNIFKETLKLLVVFSELRDNIDAFEAADIEKLIKSEEFLSAVKRNACDLIYAQLISNMGKNKGNNNSNINLKSVKQNNLIDPVSSTSSKKEEGGENKKKVEQATKALREGKKVKMYKSDGSISDLLLFISSDGLQLNCGLKLSEVVKQKWRLPLNQITRVVEYPSQEASDFQGSYFEKNSGFFNKAPSCECTLSLLGKNNDFHICFFTGEERKQWQKQLDIVRENAKSLLAKLK